MSEKNTFNFLFFDTGHITQDLQGLGYKIKACPRKGCSGCWKTMKKFIQKKSPQFKRVRRKNENLFGVYFFTKNNITIYKLHNINMIV
jgi:hypothetical protein